MDLASEAAVPPVHVCAAALAQPIGIRVRAHVDVAREGMLEGLCGPPRSASLVNFLTLARTVWPITPLSDAAERRKKVQSTLRMRIGVTLGESRELRTVRTRTCRQSGEVTSTRWPR
jgi:hypothetical protein